MSLMLSRTFRLLTFLCLFITTQAFANSITFGHNLSPTPYTLKENTTSLGLHNISYGVTDKITIATSPWIYNNYHMHNIFVKNRWKSTDRWIVASQTGYFDTFDDSFGAYQMTAVYSSLINSFYIKPYFITHLNVNYMYFFYEKNPFSFRREPFNDQPWQISATSLQEFRINKNFGVFAEAGILGVNYKHPHFFGGASVYAKNERFLLQLGYSFNFKLSGVFRVNRIGFSTYEGNSYSEDNELDPDAAMHPEFQAQFFF